MNMKIKKCEERNEVKERVVIYIYA